MYGPTFLNPWLRFHWVDSYDPLAQKWTAQYTTIAFNDGSNNNHLVLLTPSSMTEYLKWLAAFAFGSPKTPPQNDLPEDRTTGDQF